jgi:type IV pilus assembly protein PilP
VFAEADFTPSERNRDPFRAYRELINNKTVRKIINQQQVIADQYSLDEMKLIAIVAGHVNARAMLVDPKGKGHIVTRGQLIGRSETERVGTGNAGTDYEATWKVERIREGDVVFVREVPGQSTPVSTRIVALRPEPDATTTTPRR